MINPSRKPDRGSSLGGPLPVAAERPFRAFLSHRYKSPRVNEYFFSLFEGIGIPLFQVDEGIKTTCVTRLERMVRDSDGFIGLYPFPSESDPNAENLREASRYFRLELDLAERAGKPAISFIDESYGAVVRPAPSIVQVRFRDAEVVLGARMPAEEDVKLRISEFCNRVEAARAYGLSRSMAGQDRTKVGILLPPDDGSGTGYAPEHISLIEEEIQRVTPPREAVRMRWPPMLDSQFEAALEDMDWVVVDLGPISTACGIVSYLHGHFTPMLRLRRVTKQIAEESSESQFEKTLYGSFEVGYRKDIVRWTDEANLKGEIDKRIGLINFKSTFFASRDEALKYFRKAALRNEAVFVSYRGADRARAGPIIEALKRKFQVVFDYAPADERSIAAGTNWIEEIFRQIATMPLGTMLLSPDYLESGNCLHEMNEMIAQRDSGRMRVVPIRLRDVPLPPAIRAIQYLRTENFENADQLVAAFIQDIDRAKSG
jgi:TIR domain-containing protein